MGCAYVRTGGWPILRLPTLVAIPVLILLISLMEIVGFLSVKGDMFWWCDYDTYGFFGSLLRVIPFIAVVWMQLRCLYPRLLGDQVDLEVDQALYGQEGECALLVGGCKVARQERNRAHLHLLRVGSILSPSKKT
uniref:hypothetical protein n=1 Tax=Alistipes sp. TaxID=1872444 RepID=UPI004055F21C